MSLVSYFKGLLSSKEKSKETNIIDTLDENDISELAEEVKKVQTFKSENIVFNKLTYLEQYIKIFSLTFPEEYNKYLTIIHTLKEDYSNELNQFQKGKNGNITFSIDPEHESDRLIEAVALEDEIKRFVEFEVDYKDCKDKFSKLCYKVNVFYNAIIDTAVQRDKIISQVNNAYNSLEKLVKDLDERKCIANDSRKKDEILNYIIYCDYIIFKTFFRMGIISDFNEYKQEISKIYSFFESQQYDNLMFNFFIESVEEIQILISRSFASEQMLDYVLKETQNVERKLNDYDESFNNYIFFQDIIKLENTIYGLIKLHKVAFTFDISKMISFNVNQNIIISINNIAKSILSLINSSKAKLLERIVNSFKIEISWREFFFLCKIFELTDDIVEISGNTVFSMIKDKFLKLEEKYSEYTNEYIYNEKQHILRYTGNKEKKYIVLLSIFKNELVDITELLNTLSLDFVIKEDVVYLNHSYFNGFKNLEENFGQEIIL